MGKPTKDCWGCSSELPKTEFRYDSRYRDNLYPYCEYCLREIDEGVRVPTNDTEPQSDKI